MRYFNLLFVIGFIAQVSQAQGLTPNTEIPLSKTGLRIVHSEGASCYDQDQIYKRCVDQKQIFEIAKEQAKSVNKDLLLVYGYDTCCWCRAIHNLLHFSDEAQKFQDAFVIRTIAKSSGNGNRSTIDGEPSCFS